jgi:2-(1,2-epoxy-1,2-dihydrophenyl)acetyl-CoA isomerase
LDDSVLVRREGQVAIVTLNRPDTLNALNADLMQRLPDDLRVVAEDDAVRCVILTGAGRGFCSGGDVKAISSLADRLVKGDKGHKGTTEFRTHWLRRCVEAARWLHEMPKPTLAMINGACAGAGMSLAAACDFRFAGASAKFVPAFTSVGLSGDYGGSWLWTHILGTAKARQLYLLGEPRDARSALEFGIVDRIFPDESLEQETVAVARGLSTKPYSGVAYAKANLNAALSEGFVEFLDRESLNMMLARDAITAARKAAAATRE